MAKSNTRLELTWIGKENRPKLEPRFLIVDASKKKRQDFFNSQDAIDRQRDELNVKIESR